MSKLLFIRHAQASYGTQNYDQLSPLGLRQADILGEYLAAHRAPFTRLYVGPLKRHHQTLAATLAAYRKRNLPEPEIVERAELIEHQGPKVMGHVMPTLLKSEPRWRQWMEESENNFELRRKHHLTLYDEVVRRWAVGTLDDLAPDFQSWADFREEVARGMRQIMRDNPKGANVGIFSSGGTMSAAVGFAAGMNDPAKVIDLNGMVFNTAFSEMLFSGERLSLRTFNETPHLEEEGLFTLV